MSGRIAVVDAENRFIGWEKRRTIHERHLFHRSVHVILFDSSGRLVIQRRHRNKQTYPNYWDISTCGHVEEEDYPGFPDNVDPDAHIEEVYHQTARRELQEELGIDAELTLLGAFAPVEGVHYEHIRLFRACHDGPYVRQVEEVEEIRVVSREELAQMREIGEKLTRSLNFFVQWMEHNQLW